MFREYWSGPLLRPRHAIIGTVLAGLTTGPVMTPALAQSTLAACAQIPSAAARLSCYDQLAHPAPFPAAPPSVPASPPETFGQETLPRNAPPAAGRVNRITSSVQVYTVSATGRFTVTLSNGQVWRQMEGDNIFRQFHRGRVLLATISRGAFGSYDLKFSDHSALYKVTRVR